MTLALATLLAFLLGYLARRWHRPVGHRAQPDPAATVVMLSGGEPYTAFSVQSQQPLAGQALLDVVHAMRAKSGVGTP